MNEYTRDQAIAEARRLDRRGRKQTESYGFFMVMGCTAGVLGLVLLVFVAGSASPEDAGAFRTWGICLLVGGVAAVVIALATRSTAMRGARTIRRLSQQYGFDPRDLEARN